MATNNVSRLIIFRSKFSPRYLSTATAMATETGAVKEKESLYRRLSALGGTEGSASDTVDEWVKEGNSVKRFDIVNYINQLRKFKKYHHALQLYEWMEKGNSKLNNADHARRIDLLLKTEGIASAENYFTSLEGNAKTNKTYGALLNCYCKQGMLEKATEVFEKMKELNFASSALSYNNMMFLYLKLGQPEKIPLLAREMEEKNIAADLYTYNQLIDGYASVKDFDAMEKVVEKMETDGVKPDWFMYGNLATKYVNAELVDKANATLQKMEKMENLHDREAFHTLITLYARTSNSAGVKRVWESLKLAHPKMTNVSYLIMLLSLFKLGDVIGLEGYFKEWESSCSLYDVRVSNVVLESYLNRDMIEEAKLLSESVVKRGAAPNLRTLHLFMNFYLKKSQMDSALQYLEKGTSHADLKKNKWFPAEANVNMFLNHFGKEKDVDGFEKFCESMRKYVRLNGKIYNSVLKTFIAAGNMESEMRSRMKEDGIEITSETEDLLQKVCL